MPRIGIGGVRFGGGGAPIATFSPAGISGLNAWYYAGAGVTLNSGRVSAWADQSNTGDANKNATQVTAGKQPLFTASDANLNTMPSLQFDRTRMDELVTGTWATPHPAPATWLVVGRVEATAANDFFIDGLASGNRQVIYSSSTGTVHNIYSSAGVSKSGYSVPLAVVMGGVIGTSAKLFVNAKTAVATGNTGADSLLGLRIGSGISAGLYHQGSIAEIVGYSRALTDGEVGQLLDHFGAKYGITIGA